MGHRGWAGDGGWGMGHGAWGMGIEMEMGKSSPGHAGAGTKRGD